MTSLMDVSASSLTHATSGSTRESNRASASDSLWHTAKEFGFRRSGHDDLLQRRAGSLEPEVKLTFDSVVAVLRVR